MTDIERRKEILEFVRDLKSNLGSDPFRIAEYCGIRVLEKKALKPAGSTIRMTGYPAVITLYGCETQASRHVICAHELGHALLHEDVTVNRFDGTYAGIMGRSEHEANLFAVALLFDENDFNCRLEDMSNYSLKSILDYNLR